VEGFCGPRSAGRFLRSLHDFGNADVKYLSLFLDTSVHFAVIAEKRRFKSNGGVTHMRLRLFSCIGVLAFVALSACATETAATEAPGANATPATAEAGDDAAMAEVKEHHRHHHLGGITQFIAMSLDVSGSDAAKQTQIRQVQADLHTCMGGAHQVNKSLLAAVAEGVAAGAVDASKVDPLLTQLQTAADGAHWCSVASLDALHALLTPEERLAVVDKVQAHWEVWRQANHEAAFGGTEKGGRLNELATELSLSADQVQKMSAALQAAHAAGTHTFEPARAEAHLKAFATAFASDDFNARSVMENANGHVAVHGAKRMVLFYETVTPLLTADQRATLAAHLKEHSSHHAAAGAEVSAK
jgi:Spy/CpxP family protein refolding chaperone